MAQTEDEERNVVMKEILTEWRKYINENSQGEPQKFPESIYYAIPASELDSVRDNGIVNMPTPEDAQHLKMGVPTCDSIQGAMKHGDVVLEISGQYLNESGQYVCNPNSTGHRVTMSDSSYSSGSGIDAMVDQLGTNIPFTAVKSMTFSRKPNIEKLKNSGFAGVELALLPADNTSAEPQTLYTPEEEHMQ